MKPEAENPEAPCEEAGPSSPAVETRAWSSPFGKGSGQAVGIVVEQAGGLTPRPSPTPTRTSSAPAVSGLRALRILRLGQVGGSAMSQSP